MSQSVGQTSLIGPFEQTSIKRSSFKVVATPALNQFDEQVAHGWSDLILGDFFNLVATGWKWNRELVRFNQELFEARSSLTGAQFKLMLCKLAAATDHQIKFIENDDKVTDVVFENVTFKIDGEAIIAGERELRVNQAGRHFVNTRSHNQINGIDRITQQEFVRTDKLRAHLWIDYPRDTLLINALTNQLEHPLLAVSITRAGDFRLKIILPNEIFPEVSGIKALIVDDDYQPFPGTDDCYLIPLLVPPDAQALRLEDLEPEMASLSFRHVIVDHKKWARCKSASWSPLGNITAGRAAYAISES